MAAETQTRETTRRKSGEIDEQQAIQDLGEVCQEVGTIINKYARSRPEVFAMVCVGVGFFLGWKLKPW
jgi:hypothetical protein